MALLITPLLTEQTRRANGLLPRTPLLRAVIHSRVSGSLRRIAKNDAIVLVRVIPGHSAAAPGPDRHNDSYVTTAIQWDRMSAIIRERVGAHTLVVASLMYCFTLFALVFIRAGISFVAS